MNILFCGDNGVRDGITLSTLSICKNTNTDINFFILTATAENHKALSQKFANELQILLRAKFSRHSVTLIDITEQFHEYLPLANMSTRFTPMCMLRLFSDLIPELPQKLLYLDSDVLCRSNFEDMYNTDLKDYDIAGAPDRYGKWFFGNILKHDYLNSGVLLINMARIRENGLFERCRRMCRDKKMFMPDQSALNRLAKKLKIPARYNNQGKIKRDTVFKHFTTFFRFVPYFKAVTIKPWQTDKLHDTLKIFEFDDILEEYQRSIKR